MQTRQQAAATASDEPQQESDVNWQDQTYGPGTSDRAGAAVRWGLALRLYVLNHDGHYPERLDDAAAHLPEQLSEQERQQAMSELTKFELVYHGTHEGIANLPPESTIVIRERQPWRGANGEWVKIYGLADGSA